MAEATDVILRQRRQITLPADFCDRLGMEVGDRLELRVQGDTLVIRAKKPAALKALNDIRRAFVGSGVSEDETLHSGPTVRKRTAGKKRSRKL
jgi:bifunctional DNA-binding transcriptional regulator/antitoxin component of YhaV-PrlF toxin-antitoxin module